MDVLGVIGNAIQLALYINNELEAFKELHVDVDLLGGQVKRVSALLSWLKAEDVRATISSKNWQSTYTHEALTAIENVLKQIRGYVDTLSKRSFVVKLFTAGVILNALKSATVRLSQHLVELHVALNIDQYASLRAQNVEQRMQAVEQHAQLLEQLRNVLNVHRVIQDAVRDALARQSLGGTTPDADTMDTDTNFGFGPGALVEQLREELQMAQQHPLRPAKPGVEKELLQEALAGNLSRVQELLQEAACDTSLNAHDANGYTLLHVAADKGLTLLVLELLRRGCDVHAQSKNGYTPLHLAALNNHVEAARLLVGGGAAVDAENKEGETPLHAACSLNHVDVARALIGMRANVHAPTQSGATPLRTCCGAGGTGAAAVARLLLQKGARADEKDGKGFVPLHAVCSFRPPAAGERRDGPDSAALVRVLVHEYEVSTELTDTAGRTPLLIAAESGNADAAAALLSLGASVKARTLWSLLTPLHVAAQFNHLEVAEKLLVPGKREVDGKLKDVEAAEVNARDQAGSTPLHVAAQHGSREVAALLLSHGAKIDAQDLRQQRPVHLAAKFNNAGVLQLLREKGADMDCKSKDGKTPKDSAPVGSQAAALLQEVEKDKGWRWKPPFSFVGGRKS